eukprot:CAMPEP_0114572598 /NCGR_PEP_ID=MMETSP0114-20121206/18392_1 /TAXON_ID=31324 /ORGANISM="Goniomonas sp, Strain m" /LENGTH=485 /DNA_ID=CAMNT_0001759849 /DNA_START=33 /DNA_END=1487 /DNA_ORIENTATION=-
MRRIRGLPEAAFFLDKPTRMLNVAYELWGLRGIDTVGEQFSVDLDIYISYPLEQHESEAARELMEGSEAKKVEGLAVEIDGEDAKGIWDPRISLVNALEGEADTTESTERWSVSFRGDTYWVCYALNLRNSKFFERFNLGKFPVDAQDLHVTIRSGWDVHNVQFQLDPYFGYAETQFQNDVMLQEWGDITSRFVDSTHFSKGDHPTLTSATSSIDGLVYHTVHIVTSVRRKPWYYVYNVALPQFLIVSLAGTIVSVPVDDVADRMGVILTLLLTTVAFKFVVASSTPQIPYLTFLDYYLFWGLAILCWIGIEISAAVYVFGPESDSAVAFDLLFLQRMAYLWGLSHIGIFIGLLGRWFYCWSRQKRRALMSQDHWKPRHLRRKCKACSLTATVNGQVRPETRQRVNLLERHEPLVVRPDGRCGLGIKHWHPVSGRPNRPAPAGHGDSVPWPNLVLSCPTQRFKHGGEKSEPPSAQEAPPAAAAAA